MLKSGWKNLKKYHHVKEIKMLVTSVTDFRVDKCMTSNISWMFIMGLLDVNTVVQSVQCIECLSI